MSKLNESDLAYIKKQCEDGHLVSPLNVAALLEELENLKSEYGNLCKFTNDFESKCDLLKQEVKDLYDVLKDKYRLTRELDVALFGDGAAEQASLVDLIGPAKELREQHDRRKRLLDELCEEWNESCDSECSSYGHTGTCKAVDLGQAKRAMREENERLRKGLLYARDQLAQYKANYSVGRCDEALNGIKSRP